MDNMNYLIKYKAYNKAGAVIKEGTVRAKNKLSGVQAQVDFEKHLKKKHKDFGRLEVTSCEEDLMGQFGNMFNKMFNQKP